MLLASLICSSSLLGISETNFESKYQDSIIPFLNSGQHFSFLSADTRYSLQGIRFIHPNSKDEKGLIVVINGFSQSWLQYGELFHDLYKKGYSVISYDHRGQGSSPHLVPNHSQVGYIDHFSDYSADLNMFMEHIVKPLHPDAASRFLIANSMGGAITSNYLETHSSPPPFAAIVLSAPMFQINTTPYPEWLGHLIVSSMTTIGLGKHYAIGMHDFDPQEPFKNNKITHSLARWKADREVKILYPKVVIGGPSNAWVNTSLSATKKIRSHEFSITTRTLLLEAGEDQLVMNQAILDAAKKIPYCRLVTFPDSKHGILMESDTIRNKALTMIERFLDGK